MTHLHRITLEIDIETNERLGTTKENVIRLSFEAIREHYKEENITIKATDYDCLMPK